METQNLKAVLFHMFSTSHLDLEKGSVSFAGGDCGGEKVLLVLGTAHANILAMATVVDAHTSARAVKQVPLIASTLYVVHPDLPRPCSQGATWNHKPSTTTGFRETSWNDSNEWKYRQLKWIKSQDGPLTLKDLTHQEQGDATQICV